MRSLSTGYDPLNRVTGAPYGYLYRSPNQGILAVQSNEYAAPSFGYDAVGNITTIKRLGMVADVDCFEPKTIDNLNLIYGPASSRLNKVIDSAPADGSPYGFKPGADDDAKYYHDANGNMTYDPHKGLNMKYNFLNLPYEIDQMRLTYDATGRKWSKDGEFGTTSYASGIEYHDGKLEAIYAPDGRMVAEYAGGQITRYRAEYFHQDHLGNTRLGFSDFNQNGRVDLEEDDPNTPLNELEVTQESHYYPLGMNQDGPWYATVAPENKYLYNGKELNEDYGIKLMDYGARWYDGAIGRWTAVDPLAEEREWVTPYSYVQNNPILRIDPDGAIDSPIYDQNGNFLGVDSEGFSGEIIIMDRQAYNTVSNNGEKTLDHEQVMIWAENSPLAAKLNDAGLSAEGFSNVYTHVVGQMKGESVNGNPFSLGNLEGGIINIIDTVNDEEGLSQLNGDRHGNPTNLPLNAEAGTIINEDGSINVTTRLLFGKGQMTTVEHTQSTLGVHEYYGHGVKGLAGGGSAEHRRVYRLEFNHRRTFDALTPKQQKNITDNM